jgi:hypothetical protein
MELIRTRCFPPGAWRTLAFVTREERLARNESRFRTVNEGIAVGGAPRDVGAELPVVCECGQLGCNDVLSVTVGEYEAVRQSGRQFIVRPGHSDPELEVVVHETPSHAVVEKLGDAAKTAEALDPRDSA